MVECSAPSQGVMKTGIAFFSQKIVFPKQSFSKLRKRKRAEKQNSTFSAFLQHSLPFDGITHDLDLPDPRQSPSSRDQVMRRRHQAIVLFGMSSSILARWCRVVENIFFQSRHNAHLNIASRFGGRLQSRTMIQWEDICDCFKAFCWCTQSQ
ncbi:hypothetical protein CDAR_221091 [Caerostris darwini]|uniref:Uncharacterized protein n=1 Tax=Caerostris darwini TaxID=1538125 RepID=A0AAV4R2R8_9ARAC|nr:hypothetical protein CDAR_221091 [Caerostris darwini]